MQQGREISGARNGIARETVSTRTSADASERFGGFGSERRIDRRNHSRFPRGLERGRRRLARSGETDGTARVFRRVRVRHREAEHHEKREAQCEARAFPNMARFYTPTARACSR